MKSFDRAAPTYESFGFIQREMASWLAEWLPTVRTGTALEVGAGTGLFTRHLRPWNGRCLATDASPAMVAQGAALSPPVEWKVALAEELPPLAADWIFSASFLQWAEAPTRLMAHWKTHLTPQGHILAGLFTAPTLLELAEVLPETAPLTWRTPAEWNRLVRAAGLQIVRRESSQRTFSFPSLLQLLRSLHGVGAAPMRRTSAAVLRKAIKEYDHRFPHPNGVRSTWTFHRFEARAMHPACGSHTSGQSAIARGRPPTK
jgi:malonyl-CoA O-methyltransferase